MNDDLKDLTIGRYKRQLQSEVFSKDETELLAKIKDLVIYAASECIFIDRNCEAQEIEAFRSQLEPIFGNIKNNGKTSSEFLRNFQEEKKAFTVLAKKVVQIHGSPPPVTPPPGVNLCTPERHVDKECFCGNEMCDIGDSCSSNGVCEKATDCPARQLNEDRRISEGEDGLEFQLVPINNTGQMATVEDVKANLEKVQKLLKRCDFAKLEDGTIEGMGYDGNVINADCTSCLYKIIKNSKGLQFCSSEKHVDKRCQCGDDICDIGNSCSRGKCNTKIRDCPARPLIGNGEEEGRAIPKDILEFQIVPIDTSGQIATVADVEANREKVGKLLMSCDIAKLEDGTIEGTGYGGNVTKEDCTLCPYKIIKNNEGKEFCPPDKRVDEKCQCGKDICGIGDYCNQGKCNNKDKECPVKQQNSNEERGLKSDELEFKMVHINETGTKATIAEVEANPEKMQKLLKRCDVAKLKDGTIEGSGYGGKVTDEDCESCQYKIIKSDEGREFCPIEKHVAKKCQCGERICDIGDSCNQGKCINKAKGCPIRKLNENEGSNRGINIGEIDFKIVPNDENGTKATVAEVKANPEKMKKLLKSCDVASLKDGTIEGSGYGGNVTTENCKSCPYKIIKSDNGTMFCTAEKHVEVDCQCGTELCIKGDICTGGTCQKNTVCPLGYQDKARGWKKSYNTPKPINSSDIPEFRLVPINSNGPMATLKEVDENREQVLELLKECDIAKVEGGSIGGKGYDKLDRSSIEIDTIENSTEFGYQVIRVEAYIDGNDENVANRCCFILTTICENMTTYVLTNHSLLHSFPTETCSAGCIYTPYGELNYTDAPRICLDQIENYTCCSQDTGALCNKYGNPTKNNIQNETCSSVCAKIANCSSEPENKWCTNQLFIEEESSQSTVESAGRIFSATTFSKPTKLTSETLSQEPDLPDHCELNPHTIPVEQTAEKYPKALPPIPFTETRNSQTRDNPGQKRTNRACRYWGFWKYTCTQAYNYPTYKAKENYYKQAGQTCKYFKHACCSILQPHCPTYTCPLKSGGNGLC